MSLLSRLVLGMGRLLPPARLLSDASGCFIAKKPERGLTNCRMGPIDGAVSSGYSSCNACG